LSALEVCIQTRCAIQIDVYFTLPYFRGIKVNTLMLDNKDMSHVCTLLLSADNTTWD